MSIDFAAAMRRATAATRALDVAEATRIIRQALGKQPSEPHAAPAARNAATRPAAEIEDAEIVPGAEPAAATPGAARSARWCACCAKAAAGPAPRGPRPVPPVPVPDGARFEARSYRGAAGARDYSLYIPARPHERPAASWSMLHGCTQNPEDFAAGTGMNALAEERGFLVAYPQQTAGRQSQRLLELVRPRRPGARRGEPAIIAGLTARGRPRVRRRPAPGLRRRPLRRRRHGRGPRRDLPRPLRRGRRPFRPRPRRRQRRRLRLRRDARQLRARPATPGRSPRPSSSTATPTPRCTPRTPRGPARPRRRRPPRAETERSEDGGRAYTRSITAGPTARPPPSSG